MFILDSLVFHRLPQHACFSFCRVWRRCQAASPVFSGWSTPGWSGKPRRVAELESTRHESQDRAVEVTEVRAVELLAAERATAAEWGLEAAKVHQAKIEVVL